MNGKNRQGWKQNPEAVKADILRVAMGEFAKNGFSGARVDEIAAKTKTSKRMLYYYFGDKENLYRLTLEAAYSDVRQSEEELDLAGLPPADALRKLVMFTFDHHRKNSDFIRLVMIENIHHGEYLFQSEVIKKLNVGAIKKLEDICNRGTIEGVFRDNLDPLKLHWMISAFSFFNVSNQPTFTAIFGDALFEDTAQEQLRDQITDAIMRFTLTFSNTTDQGNTPT